jgi:cobyrinic acid a,c-diamide synthase
MKAFTRDATFPKHRDGKAVEVRRARRPAWTCLTEEAFVVRGCEGKGLMAFIPPAFFSEGRGILFMHGAVIAGTHSGCGKTTVTLGILAALQRKGYTVQPFKTGPDFIDTSLHKLITGRTSRNLDLWMCGVDYVKNCFEKHSTGTDTAVVEGVMGMYDGEFNSAWLAAVLGLPVILVVDAYGMAESAGAVVRGYREQGAETGVNIAGIIFNRVASDRHYKRLRESIQNVPALGYLPRDFAFEIPHRHLGLVVAEETPIDPQEIDKLADAVLEHVDVEAIIQNTVASGDRARNQGVEKKDESLSPLNPRPLDPLNPVVKIAVAYDRAFCFYYEDNLDLLKEKGAEIITFSPLSDSRLPVDIDALYIGGGYPELYAEQLSKNKSMLEAIRNFSEKNLPVYAECGGFMYLTEGIYDFEDNFYPMAGVFLFKTRMKKGRSKLGYREAVLKVDSIFGGKGTTIRGHEFHYSEIINRTQNTEHRTQTKEQKDKSKEHRIKAEDDSFHLHPRTLESSNPDLIYSVKDGSGKHLSDEGYKVNNTLGSYIHIHFGSNPAIAGNLIKHIKERYGTDTVSRTRQSQTGR